MSELEVDEKKEDAIDSECSICLGTMAEPTQLSCKHRFCIGCLGKNFIQTSKCPLCRKQVSKTLKVDEAFQKKVKDSDPTGFEKRYKDLDKAGNLFKDQIKVQFEVGNRCTPSKAKKDYYDWEAFVRLKNHKDYKIDSIIEKVTF